MRKASVRSRALRAALTASLWACPISAFALTINVDSDLDLPDANVFDGKCSYLSNPDPAIASCTLRAAVMQANAIEVNPDSPAISISLRANEKYFLGRPPSGNDATGANGDLDLNRPMRVGVFNGSTGNAIISANSIDRIFDIRPGAAGSLLSRLDITGGFAADDLKGAAVRTTALNTRIESSRVFDNHAAVALGIQCAVAAVDTSSVTFLKSEILENGGAGNDKVAGLCVVDEEASATVERSSIYDNSLHGIYAEFAKKLIVADSTISENFVGVISIVTPTTIQRSTIAENYIDIKSDGSNGAATPLGLFASIIGGCILDFTATTSFSNVFSSHDCQTIDDVTSTVVPDLGVGNIADNGGPTATMLPELQSEAVDFIDGIFCNQMGVDQRGLPRAVSQSGLPGAACDAGAVELEAASSEGSEMIFRDGLEDPSVPEGS